ncbi:MAG: M61 family metallopeptidase [Proteobacteria bacterium]|nr:M61 family metallopeptidase [Pseudomonadota bacterium]
MIHYEVNADKPASHLFNIRMTIPKGDENGQQVSMPTWIPGSYLIRDFARHIVSIEAFAKDQETLTPLFIEKINSNTWQCEKTAKPIVLNYTVYAWDPSVRGAHLDEHHGFFNSCCLLLSASHYEDKPCKLLVNPPKCQGADTWRVATTLTRTDGPSWGFGSFSAKNYDELIDHPFEMGQFETVEFKVKDIPHTIVLSGKHDGDLTRLKEDVQKICLAHCELFGEIPFERYLFLLTVLKEGYGGLEHRSSTALLAPREFLPIKGDKTTSRNYITLLALFSHEYFHAWNVKRIKPESFVPYDLNHKSYTKQLWAFEGITSYYDELALLRAKVITLEQYLDLLAQTLTRVLRTQGRFRQTLVDASFDAWIKYYQPNENSSNSQVSYYLKGSLAALAFDLAIRNQSNHQKSLDDLMRTLWSNFGENIVGVPEGKIEELLIEIGGEKLKKLIFNALYTTQDLPLESLLAAIGLKLTLRTAQSNDDMGGKKLSQNNNNGFKQGIFEFTLNKVQGRLMVASVVENGAAMNAGISSQDEIIALNGLRVDGDAFDKIAKRLQVGQNVRVTYFRQDTLKETTVNLKAAPLDTAEISMMENLSEPQKKNLTAWLQVEF